MSPGSMFKAPSTTTTTPVTAAGSDDGPGPLWQRMEQIIANDQEKTHFIHVCTMLFPAVEGLTRSAWIKFG